MVQSTLQAASPRSFLRRLWPLGPLLLLCVGVLRTPDEKGGLITVHVFTPGGQRVPGAQARLRQGDQPWRSVPGDAGLPLGSVVLPARPSRTDVLSAVEVRAPFFAQRAGLAPLVESTGAAWEIHYRLAPHGVLRLDLQPHAHGEAHAFIEGDEPLRRLEVMDGMGVARRGQSALYRVFAGLESLILRVEGDSDPYGAVRAARQRRRIAAPRPGEHVVFDVDVTGRRVLVGRVALLPRLAEASLAGRILLWNARDPTVLVGDVPLAPEGTFQVDWAGAGPHLLQVESPLFERGPLVAAHAEADLVLEPGAPRPWVILKHPLLAPSRPLRVTVESPAGPPDPEAFLHRGRERSVLVLFPGPPAGSLLRLVARVPGTPHAPPLGAALDLTWEDGSATAVSLPLAPQTTGTLELEAAKNDEALGARIRLREQERETTLLPGLSRTVRIENVAAGRVLVEVDWRGDAIALEVFAVVVRPGQTTHHPIQRRPSGALRLLAPQEVLQVDAADRVLEIEPGQSPYGEVALTLLLERRAVELGWEASALLLPGAYAGRLEVAGAPGPGETVAFSIQEGVETTLELGATTPRTSVARGPGRALNDPR